MKNKIMACLLVLSMLFVGVMFTGCSETAAEVVEPAFKSTQALKSYSATMVVAVKCDNELKIVDNSVTSKIEVNGDKIYVNTGNTGDNKTAEYYTDGEWVYSYASKLASKKKVSDENKLTYADDLKALFKAPDSANLAELEVIENEDGTKSVSVAIPDEEMNKKFAETVAKMSPFNESNLPVELYNGKIDVVVTESGYISSYKMTCSTDRTWIGNQLVHDITVDITFDAPGSEVTVTDLPGRDVKFIEMK